MPTSLLYKNIITLIFFTFNCKNDKQGLAAHLYRPAACNWINMIKDCQCNLLNYIVIMI